MRRVTSATCTSSFGHVCGIGKESATGSAHEIKRQRGVAEQCRGGRQELGRDMVGVEIRAVTIRGLYRVAAGLAGAGGVDRQPNCDAGEAEAEARRRRRRRSGSSPQRPRHGRAGLG